MSIIFLRSQIGLSGRSFNNLLLVASVVSVALAQPNALAAQSDGEVKPATPKVKAASQSRPVDVLAQKYMNSYNVRVKRNWWRPDGIKDGVSLTATLLYSLKRIDGMPNRAKVTKSSGNKNFDQGCLDAVASTIAPIADFYSASDIPIEFHFESNGSRTAVQKQPLQTIKDISEVEKDKRAAELLLAEAAQKAQPTYLPLRVKLAKYYDAYATDLIEGDKESAKKYCYKALYLNPEDATALNNLKTCTTKENLDFNSTSEHIKSAEQAKADHSFRVAFVEYQLAAKFDETPEKYFNMLQAQDAVANEDTIAKWEKALKKSDTAATRVAFGRALQTAYEFQSAKSQYEEALKLEPQSLAAKASLNALPAIEDKWKTAAEQRKNLFLTLASKEVRLYGTSANASNGESAYALNNEGVKFILKGDFEQAMVKLRQALVADPTYTLARVNLAIAHNNLALKCAAAKDPQSALYHFERATYLDPKNPTTLKNLSGTVQLVGKNPKQSDDLVELADYALLNNDQVGEFVELQQALKLHEDALLRARLADVDKHLKSDPTKIFRDASEDAPEKPAAEGAEASSPAAPAPAPAPATNSDSSPTTDTPAPKI